MRCLPALLKMPIDNRHGRLNPDLVELEHASNHVIENAAMSEVGEFDLGIEPDQDLDRFATFCAYSSGTARAHLVRHFDGEDFFSREAGFVGVFTGHVLKWDDSHSDQI